MSHRLMTIEKTVSVGNKQWKCHIQKNFLKLTNKIDYNDHEIFSVHIQKQKLSASSPVCCRSFIS